MKHRAKTDERNEQSNNNKSQDNFMWPMYVKLESLKEMEGSGKIFEEVMAEKISQCDENSKPQI